MARQQCKCGKGYVSVWDGKCGKCRTKAQQWNHEHTLACMPEGLTMEEKYSYYRMVRFGK